MILTQAQAEAIYSAMRALNKVGMRLDADNGDIRVFENPIGQVRIAHHDTEIHASQAAFAAAYGLDGKQPRTAVYTAGIGWQVQDAHGRRGNFETEVGALAA